MVDVVACIVLAGGASRRMGADKRLIPIAGQPMLLGTLARLTRLSPADTIVVVDPRDPPALAMPPTVPLIADSRPGEGPLAALEAGLRATDAATVLVVGGDMPWLEPDVLQLLVARVGSPPEAPVACLHDGERPRPLPLALQRGPVQRHVTALLDAGERRLRALLAGAIEVSLSDWRSLDPDLATLRDVDTPADLVASR